MNYTDGPPENDAARTATSGHPGTSVKGLAKTHTRHGQDSAAGSNCMSWRTGLVRRRRASDRSVPLDCGCRDPWPCRCTVPPLSDRMIDAGRDAARFILEAGYVPLLELEVLRALYRRGGADRALAVEVHHLTGGAVA